MASEHHKKCDSVPDDRPPAPPPPEVRTDDTTIEIGMEARHIMKAIKVPTTGALTDELRNKIRAAVAAHLKQHQITFREAGLACDYAANTISETVAGNYRGDVDAVLRALNQYMEDDERRRVAARPHNFYGNGVFTAILALAKFAKSNARTGSGRAMQQDASRIALGVGPAGIGKSAGALALACDEPSAIYIRVEEGGGKSTGLSQLICAELGHRAGRIAFNNLQVIKRHLTGSARLVIIDEAHRLEKSGCELVRDLADVCGVPILLLATDDFSARITRVRTGFGNLKYDQFARRVGMWLDLTRGIDGGGGTKRPIFSIEEIRAIFKDQEVRLSPDGAEYLQACACVPSGMGMLGFAANAFNKARRKARRRGSAITADDLRDAAGSNLTAAGLEPDLYLQRIEQQLMLHRAMKHAPATRIAAG